MKKPFEAALLEFIGEATKQSPIKPDQIYIGNPEAFHKEYLKYKKEKERKRKC